MIPDIGALFDVFFLVAFFILGAIEECVIALLGRRFSPQGIVVDGLVAALTAIGVAYLVIAHDRRNHQYSAGILFLLAVACGAVLVRHLIVVFRAGSRSERVAALVAITLVVGVLATWAIHA